MERFTLGDFITRSRMVKAVRITRQNMPSIANWCSGSVVDFNQCVLDHPQGVQCVKFIEFAGRERQPQFAFACVGDWMIFRPSQGDFTCAENEIFERDYFSVASGISPSGLRKVAGLPAPELDLSMSSRERVNTLVLQAMEFQDQISQKGGDTEEGRTVADFVTDCIVRLYE